MNVDELKTAWQLLDRKLHATKTLNEQLIASMIAERSGNRFHTVRRNYLVGFTWLSLCLAAGLAVLLWNPFDYQYTLQYVPIVIYCLGLLAISGWMMQAYTQLDRVRLDYANIRAALAAIVSVYERPKKLMHYVLWVFILSQTILFPLSFLPRIAGRIGLWPAVGVTIVPVFVTVITLLIARRLGAFKDRHGARFKADLKELDQLKQMAAELE